MNQQEHIYFYSSLGELGYLSNFSRHGFGLNEKYWLTVEHYFQAQKFAGTEFEEQVRRAHTPRAAKTLGRRRDWPLRDDWEAVKLTIMRDAVLRKFWTHADIRMKLLNTSPHQLVENSPYDSFWGCGADGGGENHLGRILMEVRAALTDRAETVGNRPV